MKESSEFVSITFHDPLREADPFAQAWAEVPESYKQDVQLRAALFDVIDAGQDAQGCTCEAQRHEWHFRFREDDAETERRVAFVDAVEGKINIANIQRLAEYVYRIGVQDGEAKATAIHNEDLKEIARAARERVVR